MQRDSVPDFHKALRKARIAAGLTQTALAEKVGCRQSALSMLETGRVTAVSHETLHKIAAELGVEIPEGIRPGVPVPAAAGDAFCPNFQCLSNLPYAVGDSLFFLPTGLAGTGTHCALCGELLVRACPSCGAPFRRHGGCCGSCGTPFVEMPEGFVADVQAWAGRQQAAQRALAEAGGLL